MAASLSIDLTQNAHHVYYLEQPMKTPALQISACLLALGLTTLLPACSKKEPIRLGFVAGITGRVADLGVAGRNGASLAVEERNAAGGINGHPVELLVRDDEQTPATARRVVSDLINNRVTAIIGPMTSSMAMATAPLVNASGIVMVSPTVTTTDLAGKDDNFIRVCSTTTAYAAKSARCQFERCGLRTMAAIYDQSNSSYTESWLNDFRTTFTGLGGRVVKTIPFQSGKDTDLATLAGELVAARADVILIISNAIDAAVLCNKVRQLDSKVPIALAEWASTERFIELAGSAAEGVHVSQFLNRMDSSPRYQTFLKAYRTRFGQEPGFAGVAGYDAAMVTLEALRRQPEKSLKETILATRVFQGVQQNITFDRFGETDRKTFVSVIRNGKYITVE